MTAPQAISATSGLPVSGLVCRDLGLVEYTDVWRAMQAFTDQRNDETPDELWIVQHPSVFTLGQAGREEHLLDPGDIPVLHVDRGGQVTYHGPGQLVAYPLIDIRRLGIGVRELVTRIEQAVIDVLRGFGIDGERVAGAPGVYVAGAKIAALGLRVRRGRSFHGLAFNVSMDLRPYRRINPCGFQGLEVTSLSELTHAPIREVQQKLVACLAAELGYADRVSSAGPGLPGREQSADLPKGAA